MAQALAICGSNRGKPVIMEVIGEDGKKVGEYAPNLKDKKFQPPYVKIQEESL